MAEELQSLVKGRHQAAVDRVKAVLGADPAYAAITPAETGERLKDCTTIWRRTVDIADRSWLVDVGLPAFFPDEPPLAYLPAHDEIYLKNPHIEKDGFICTIPDSAAIDINDPVALVRYVFDDCQKILQGTDVSDFQAEFASYWNRSTPNTGKELVIIDSPDQLTTPFPAVFSENYIYAASAVDHTNRWVSNRTGEKTEFKDDENGIVIKIQAPLLPEQYPNTLSELVALAEGCDKGAAHAIKSHLADSSEKGLVLLVQIEGDGVALGGVIFDGLGLARNNSTELIHGYRMGKVPPDLLYRRARNSIKNRRVIRSAAERVDHQWIHSRGGDGLDFSKKSVVVIGSGSLGGYVAHLLARAGIGRLTVTDNDVLAWDNLGRHVLGAPSVGKSKAVALANELAKEMPHLEIKGIPKDWRDAMRDDPTLFAGKDLIVSTVADWRCEGPLNSIVRAAEMPPVLFGWVEPYAVAGHCLTVAPHGGCFECGTNEYGQFRYAVAQFEKAPLAKEPGGCTHYQHYGPIALMPIVSMIAASVVEALLHAPTDSSIKTWISDEEHFRTVHATIADAWNDAVQKRGYTRIFVDKWKKSSSCRICANKA